MKTIFSTKDMAPRERFDYYHETVCKQWIEREANADNPDTFEAELRAGGLHDIGVMQFAIGAVSIMRTPRHCDALRYEAPARRSRFGYAEEASL